MKEHQENLPVGKRLPDDYCETIEAVSMFIRNHAEHTKDNSIEMGRTISPREASHWEGNCHSARNGKQPIFALVGYKDIQSLEGKLLTFIDASFPDREQRRAFKDIVRDFIWYDWISSLDTDAPTGGKPNLT